MDETAFAFMSKQLSQFSSKENEKQPNPTPGIKPNPSYAHLFQHQANGGQDGQQGQGNETHKFTAGAKAFAKQSKEG